MRAELAANTELQQQTEIDANPLIGEEIATEQADIALALDALAGLGDGPGSLQFQEAFRTGDATLAPVSGLTSVSDRLNSLQNLQDLTLNPDTVLPEAEGMETSSASSRRAEIEAEALVDGVITAEEADAIARSLQNKDYRRARGGGSEEGWTLESGGTEEGWDTVPEPQPQEIASAAEVSPDLQQGADEDIQPSGKIISIG